MGRKAIPDQIKKARGTLQPCRATNGGKIATISAVTPPSWLPKEAKKIFKDKCNMLAAYKVLTPLDLDQLAIYANSMSEAMISIEKINTQGRFTVIQDDYGNVINYVANPYIKHLAEQIKVINKLGSEFGFSPASRSSIEKSMVKDDDRDEFSDFEQL